MTKTCRLCHETKSLTEFYKNSAARDGLITACKTCIKAANRRYRMSPRGRAMRKWRRYKDKQKIRARDAVSNTIKRGELPKAQDCKCVHCGRAATAYHHHKGYGKEHFLVVVAVCNECHLSVKDEGEECGLGDGGTVVV